MQGSGLRDEGLQDCKTCALRPVSCAFAVRRQPFFRPALLL